MPQSTVTILGAGAMGMALGVVLGDNGFRVVYWDVEDRVVESINNIHQNPRSLPDIKMDKKIRAQKNIQKAVFGADMVVFAVASPYVREVALQVKIALSDSCVIVVVAKGLEGPSFKTMFDVLREALGGSFHNRIAVLSGPTLAAEVAKRQPTSAMIASAKDNPYSKRAVRAFGNDWFRVYETRDVIGVEMAGVGKHIMSIASGLVAGLGYGENTKAWILTEAFREISRLIWKKGGQQETVYGLAGLGDTIVSAFSPAGRNRQFGELLGQGNTVQKAQSAVKETVEGINAVDSLYKMALSEKMRLPILQAVQEVVVDKQKAKNVFEDLLKNL